MTIIKREGLCHGRKWVHYMLVADQAVALVETTPALLSGLNIQRVTVQGAGDWPGMPEASVVAWKMAQGDAQIVEVSPEWRARLIELACGASRSGAEWTVRS